MGRKNGKTGLVAPVALYGLFAEGEGAEVYCVDPAARALCADLVWRPVGDLAVGDELLAFDEHAAGGYRKLRFASVESMDRIVQPSFRVRFSDGREVIASATHRWLGHRGPSGGISDWIETQSLRPGSRIRDLGTPWETDQSRGGGYLAGIFDGEGCIVGGQGGNYRRGSVVSFAQKPGIVWDTALALLHDRGFLPSVRVQNGASQVQEAKLTGLYQCLRLLGTLRPHRLLSKVHRWLDGQTPNRVSEATVETVEALGDREVVALGTSTGTLFVEGLFSHNSCAADKDQAKLVFGAAKRTVELDEELTRRSRVYRDAIEVPETGSIYRALSSEAFTKEGLSPTLVVYDELHAAPNRELYDVMALAMGARYDPLMLIVTTAGVRTDTTGQDSIAYSLYQHGRRVASREVDDPTFFMAWWEPSAADAPINAPATWAQANPGLGDILDEADIAAAAQPGRTPEAEFRIKRGNQWVTASTAALPSGAFERRAVDRRLKPGERGVLFLDGSYSGDSTGLVFCTLDGFGEVVGAWERQPDDAHWRVDIGAVEKAALDACRTYDVLEVACDPFRWQRSMQALEAAGLPIVEYNTAAPARMVPAWSKFYDAVTAGDNITHSADPRLVRHVGNMVLKIDRLGPRPVKEHRGSPRKIDLGICFVGAYDRATTLAGTPSISDRPPEVW